MMKLILILVIVNLKGNCIWRFYYFDMNSRDVVRSVKRWKQAETFFVCRNTCCSATRVRLPAPVIKHKNKVMLHLLSLNHAEMSERKVLEVSVFGSGGGFVCQLDSLQIYSCFMTSRVRRQGDIL
jgi:hypothetical protein